MTVRRTDRVGGVVLLVLGGAVAAEARTFTVGFLTDPLGPRAVPLFVATFLILAGIGVLFRPAPEPSWPDGTARRAMALAVASFVAYAVLLAPLGFVAATALEVFTLSLLFGGPPGRSALAAVVFTAALFVLFDRLLGLALPLGRLVGAG